MFTETLKVKVNSNNFTQSLLNNERLSILKAVGGGGVFKCSLKYFNVRNIILKQNMLQNVVKYLLNGKTN